MLEVAQNWNQLKFLSIIGWKNKLCCSHTMECSAAVNQRTVATGTTWVDLKDMVWSKRTKTQRNTYNVILSYKVQNQIYIK